MKLFKNLHSRWKDKNCWTLYTYSEKDGWHNWIELTFKNSWLAFNYYSYGYDEPYKTISFSFWFFTCFLQIPFFKDKKHPHGGETDCSEPPEYGFSFWNDGDTKSFFADSVHFHWKHKTKIFELPWTMISMYRMYNMKNGIKYEILGKNFKGEYPDNRRKWLSWITDDSLFDKHYNDEDGKRQYVSDEELLKLMNYQTFDFTHVCQSGTVQKTKAFAYEVDTFIRPKWFKWTGLFEDVIRAVEVSFEEPVGDKDSWKGPTYSIYSPFKKGEETVEDVVRRIEKTLKTN